MTGVRVFKKHDSTRRTRPTTTLTGHHQFLALCDEPSAAGGRRDRAEERWRDAERAESAAAAAALGVWTGGSGDADVVSDESEVEVDPAAALTFWKRADWAGYCGWAGTRLPPPPV
jgi:hypothetical protein